LSQNLHIYLKERAKLPGIGWPLGLTLSLAFHGVIVAAILFTPKAPPPPEATKVTWVTLPAQGGGEAGGSGPAEEGKEGERLRRVEEVAPVQQKPSGFTPTPNAFGIKLSHPLKGTSLNPDSLGKAPVASKGKAPDPNAAVGAAGHGGGGGVGSGVPGLKNSAGVQGGTGLIGDLDSDFPFLWYLQQTQNRITGQWNRLNSAQGRVQIYFRIKRDGSIDGARIESPSGNATLDQSALLAVRRSDPLARLPEGYEGQTLGVRFWFTYLGAVPK
jgi:TonB family protein